MFDDIYFKSGDYEARNSIINLIKKKYSFAQISVLSKTVCNRDISCIQLGSNTSPVLFAGAFHGMEWLTSLILLKFTIEVCEAIQNSSTISDVDIKKFLSKCGLFIIPCVNPDGVEISLHGPAAAGNFKDLVYNASNGNTTRWQANAKGVDINHNFNANWSKLHELEKKHGILTSSPTRYGGPFPNSEIETCTLVKLCCDINFRHALAFHSQGEEIYWDFNNCQPPCSKCIANVLADSSGYKLNQPEPLATGGGFKDWFISYFYKPAFTIEVGLGRNPLPISELEPIYKKIHKMMVLAVTS